ncbi:ubiquitin-conjugating enzyme E2 E1 [Drosophila hydei]|uniref:E2 ubiquitin-conjugating enzyme n=1 Tax=Drosophila hydei TaxID=7224 RepID=A0A6J2SMD6_DROHY|nr:ubiquitin-conjugating enzyme E2 E1 [Drosophila hydei]
MPMTQLNGPVMRIKRELNEIVQNPPPNCSAEMCKDDLFHWKAIIIGPSGTAYEGGIFKLDIRFPGAYPFRPPQIRFITRIYHCNVDSRGVICLDVLNERWSPVMNIAKVLLSIWVLIGECNPNDPLVMGIADQYKCNRKEHDKVARYWTKRFAMPKSKSSSKFEQEVMLSNGQERDKDQEQELEQVSEQISGLELVGASDLTAEQVLETQNQNHNQDQEEETAASSGASSVNVSADRSRNQL